MPVKENTSAAPRLCGVCEKPIIGRHGKSRVCWECHAAGNTMHTIKRREYRKNRNDGGLVFKHCEDCRTCDKLTCRHNPKNPARKPAE